MGWVIIRLFVLICAARGGGQQVGRVSIVRTTRFRRGLGVILIFALFLHIDLACNHPLCPTRPQSQHPLLGALAAAVVVDSQLRCRVTAGWQPPSCSDWLTGSLA